MEFGPILRSMSRNKVRYGLIVLEIALTLAIVTNCVSLIRDAKAELGKESGFDDQHILSVRTQPFAPKFKETGYVANSVRQDLDVLRRLPGAHPDDPGEWRAAGAAGRSGGRRGCLLAAAVRA